MISVEPKFLLGVATLFTASISSAEVFDSDGVQIFYTDQGEGEPVILIHGFADPDMYGWTGILEGLVEDYRVVTMDARGHGASGKPHDSAVYGDQMVEDVINLLDYLDIDRADLVGYSMGGAITQKLITRYPERAHKAISGGAGWAGGEPAQSVVTFEKIADSLESGEGFMPMIVALGSQELTPEQIDEINQAMMAQNDVAALAAVARAMPQILQVTENELRANRVPLLYVVGGRDPFRADVERARPIAGNAQFVVIPETDHITIMPDPRFLEAIRKFLAD